MNQAGIEVEGWGVGARVDGRYLEAEEGEPSHRVKTGIVAQLTEGGRCGVGHLTISPSPLIPCLPSSNPSPLPDLLENQAGTRGVMEGQN